jgi:glycosyltransferase involved in cell wall biosynthesis
VGLEPPAHHSHTPDAAKLAREEAEYAAAGLMLTPSAYVAQTFRDRGIPSDRLAHHGYGHDPAVFRPVPGARPEGRPFTAVFAGAGEPRKGLHYALEAWHASGASAHGRLVICGRLEPGYARVLAPLLDHPSIDRRDFCPDLAGVLADADVLVLPSVEEGSALVTYEAMACGAVPLVSEAVGAPCRDGVDGLVHHPRDAAALADHLRTLSQQPERLRQMRVAALEAAPGLTWTAAGERLVAAYQRALRRSDATAPPTATTSAVLPPSARRGAGTP